MRKRLLSTALGLGLALGIGFAAAQTVNKALQLSQDATGAFTVDSFFGVNFPGHIFSNATGFRPSPSVLGTGTPTLSGTDTAGLLTMGTSATTGQVTFGTAYGAVPSCVVTGQNLASVSPIYVLATTGINITQTPATTGNKYNYICLSSS